MQKQASTFGKLGSSTLSRKITIMILCIIVVSTTVIGIFSFVIYRRDSVELTAEQVVATAQSVAALIEPSHYRAAMETFEKNEHFSWLETQLGAIKAQRGLAFLHAGYISADGFIGFAEGLLPGESFTADLGTELPASNFPPEAFEAMAQGITTVTDPIYARDFGVDADGFFVTAYAPIFDEFNNTIGIVAAILIDQAAYAAADAFALSILWIVLATAFALIWFPIFYFKRLITKPLRLYDEWMRLTSDGIIRWTDEEKAERAKYESRRDEIGTLVNSYVSLIDYMEEVRGELERIGSGDLSFDVIIRNDEDAISTTLSKMANNLNNMFGEVKSSTAQVASGSKQIADGSQSLAQGSTEQASSVEQLSTSIAEIARKTKDNANMAEKAAMLAADIKNSAEKGSKQMDEMMSAVKDINASSQNIGKVIKSIDDIAFQTNILALNAAVEAARAGQHGKGFAVVAEEVRSLAAKSAESAKDTERLIADSIERAELGSRIADETAASLTEIVSGIDESNQLIADIAKSSEEQTVGIEQINRGIDQVAQVVQQTSATAEESAAAAEEMDSQSTMLEELVSQFKLKGGKNTGLPSLPKANTNLGKY